MPGTNKTNKTTALTTQTPPPVINGNTLEIYDTAGRGSFRQRLAAGQIVQTRAEIGRALVVCYEVVGIPPGLWPSDILKPLIADFILKNYPQLNDDDILNAFLFAIEGRYGPVNPDSKKELLELYGRPVSILWISEILKAYTLYRAAELENAAKLLTRAAVNPVTEHLKTRPLNNQAVRTVLIDVFSRVLENQDSTAFLLPEFFGFLQDNGLVDLTPEERQHIKAEAEKQLTEEAKDATVSGGGFLNFDPGNPDNITDRAKKIGIIRQFEKYRTAGVNEFLLISMFDRVCYLSPTAHRKLFIAQKALGNAG